jgi:hypothetical protein
MMIRHAILPLAFAAILIGCSGGGDQITPEIVKFPKAGENNVDLPELTFKEKEIDFGTIVQGEQIQKTFTFTNTGKAPLVLAQVSTSCGCTVAKDWPREPIKPGKKGSITINFDSNEREGLQDKVITIVANTRPSDHNVRLKGMVKGPHSY